MRILFLDIDGVLNTPGTYARLQAMSKERKVLDSGYYLFDKKRVKLLNELNSNVHIIISSSWRFIYTVNDVYKMLYYNGYRRKGTLLGMVSRNIVQDYRGIEIYNCLTSIKAKDPNYVILDDDSSAMRVHEDRFIYVNGSIGLMQSHIDKVQKLLK